MKITVDLEDELYRAVKVEAARADRSVRDAISEALERWLEYLEDEEDIASSKEALAEYERDGGVAAAEVFRHLAGGGGGQVRLIEARPEGVTETDGYDVRLTTRAIRELRRLPPGEAARLRGPILALGLEPRPYGAVPVRDAGLWRLRVGPLRVVYEIDDAAHRVTVTRIARRAESTYRRLKDDDAR